MYFADLLTGPSFLTAFAMLFIIFSGLLGGFFIVYIFIMHFVRKKIIKKETEEDPFKIS